MFYSVLWIQNYFFRIWIQLFRKFWIWIRLRIRFRIWPNLSVSRQILLCLRILDRPGLIFNAINLKIIQLIGLIVVYNLWKFQIDSLKIEIRTSSSDPDPKLIITDPDPDPRHCNGPFTFMNLQSLSKTHMAIMVLAIHYSQCSGKRQLSPADDITTSMSCVRTAWTWHDCWVQQACNISYQEKMGCGNEVFPTKTS